MNPEAQWSEVKLTVADEDQITSTLKAYKNVETQEVGDRGMRFINVKAWHTLKPDMVRRVPGEA